RVLPGEPSDSSLSLLRRHPLSSHLNWRGVEVSLASQNCSEVCVNAVCLGFCFALFSRSYLLLCVRRGPGWETLRQRRALGTRWEGKGV
ncbi:mCG1044253, partial [Mus musculus]